MQMYCVSYNIKVMEMARLITLTLGLLLVGFCSAAQRIVGGEPTSVEMYPSIVQVDSFSTNKETWEQNCGANILTNLFVLSAAHCFDGPFYSREHMRIRAGATYRNSGGVIINIIREFNHPKWGSLGNEGDISVVRLATPLTFGSTIQPTRIPSASSVVPDNVPVRYAGWGRQWDGGPSSSVLLHVQVYTINNDLCRERLKEAREIVTPDMICAGVWDEGGRDACGGDSGGPLYLDDVTVGIISWGIGCAEEKFPGITIAVASYTEWILGIANP